MKRSFTESHKRIVASRQKWTCGGCGHILSSAFQVDHTVPLWRVGADDVENAQALCPNCHAVKTQRENIERTQLRRLNEERRRTEALREKMKRIREEEEKKRVDVCFKNGGKQCSVCLEKYYGLFRHKCAVVEARIKNKTYELEKEKKIVSFKDTTCPFRQFRFNFKKNIT